MNKSRAFCHELEPYLKHFNLINLFIHPIIQSSDNCIECVHHCRPTQIARAYTFQDLIEMKKKIKLI